MRRANVVGVGLGYKESGGRKTGTKALVVLVSRKVHPATLRAADRVPKAVSEIQTDVIEVGEIKLLLPGPAQAPALESNDRTVRLRPARPGISVGHYQITAGTFGALVFDAETHAPLILSNNHVLANISDGNDGRAKVGDPIYQPGKYDGGTADDTIGHLERFAPIVKATAQEACPIAQAAERIGNAFLRLVFPTHRLRFERRSGGENLIDAAVASLINVDDATGDIMEVGLPGGTAEATPGLKILKSGRTSGVSHGEVKVIGATVSVGLGDAGYAVFTDQIVTTAIAQPGDSGSLVVTEDGHHAIGLLSAGSDQATIVSKMSNIFKLLNVTL